MAHTHGTERWRVPLWTPRRGAGRAPPPYGPAACLWNTSCILTGKRLVQGLEKTAYLPVSREEEQAMAEQRTPGSGGTPPAQQRGSPGGDTPQEVSALIT